MQYIENVPGTAGLAYTYDVQTEPDQALRMLGMDVEITRNDGVSFHASRSWVTDRVTLGEWQHVPD